MSKNNFLISTCMAVLLMAAIMASCKDIYDSPKKTEFTISPSVNSNSSLVFVANGQTVTLDDNPITPAFTVACNQPWVVKSYQTWLTVNSSETGFTLTVTENTSEYERKGSLLLQGGEAYYTWVVTQLPNN